jgi:hypothetical protein
VIFPEIAGLALILLLFALMAIFAIRARRRLRRDLREIPTFTRLRRAVGLAVEAGNRLHLSLGRGNIIGPQSAAAFAGLSMLERIARSTSDSDRPPIATAGEGALAILAQDTLRATARSIGADFDPISGRLAGLTPFSYAAGTLSIVHDEEVGANVLVGSFGSEIALITEAGERAGSLNVGGTDNTTGQAVLYATAHEALIGEEAYAGGAYLGSGAMHTASLHAQDVLRWLLIALILAGAVLKFAGLL